jgi:hypothetical protein
MNGKLKIFNEKKAAKTDITLSIVLQLFFFALKMSENY